MFVIYKSRVYFELWLITMSNVIENGFLVSNNDRNLAYIFEFFVFD